jgi:sugar/nucleoside kinase (ribokinase family)
MTGGRRIVVFGDVIDDIIVVPHGPVKVDDDTPSSVRHRAGGSAANAAAWMASAGAEVDFVGLVAAEDVGRHSELLELAGVTPHLGAHPSLPTGAIVVIVDQQNRTMLTERGANAELDPDAVSDDLLAGAALLHFSGYSIFDATDLEPYRRMIRRAAAHGVAVSVDPGSARLLARFGVERFLSLIDGVGILLPNLEEGRALTGQGEPAKIVGALSDRFELVALTLGETGVLVGQRGSGPLHTAAIDTPILDSTGAGDAFAAGFLASWAEASSGSGSESAAGPADVAAAAEAGVRLAARAVSVIGGRPRAG